MKLSDVDQEIEDTEEALIQVARLMAEFEPHMEQIFAIHLKVTETYRKLTNATEKLEDRLKLLREIQRIIKIGHQMPPDLAAQLAAVGELLSVPGLAEALEADRAPR